MEDLKFLDDIANGNATLSARYIDGTIVHITGLDLEAMQETSPLLGYAFEDTRTGPKYCLENVTQTALASLLRYIYSDPQDYVPEQCKDHPVSLLVTVQVYRLADIYDIEGLRILSKGNLIQACEFSCSSPATPLDLCDAIRFVYENLPTHADIVDTLANYCVSMFLYHKLGEDTAFRDLAYEHRRFQQDLCMVNIRRGFVDDAALAIIQLPIKPFDREHEMSMERAILRDVLYEMWSVLDEIEDQSKPVQSTKHTGPKIVISPNPPASQPIDSNNNLEPALSGPRSHPFSYTAPYRSGRNVSPVHENRQPHAEETAMAQPNPNVNDWPLADDDNTHPNYLPDTDVPMMLPAEVPSANISSYRPPRRRPVSRTPFGAPPDLAHQVEMAFRSNKKYFATAGPSVIRGHRPTKSRFMPFIGKSGGIAGAGAGVGAGVGAESSSAEAQMAQMSDAALLDRLERFFNKADAEDTGVAERDALDDLIEEALAEVMRGEDYGGETAEESASGYGKGKGLQLRNGTDARARTGVESESDSDGFVHVKVELEDEWALV